MISDSTFRPAWWLPGAHLQTLYPSLFRKRTVPTLTRERLELADGDFVDIDWTTGNGDMTVLLLHGLEGSLESHYTGGLLCALERSGYTAGLMYFRGCSGEPNRLPRSYHSGDTGDIETVVRHIKKCRPEKPLAAIGVSLGGNVLLKWLGEQGHDADLTTAIAISVPFDLHEAALKLGKGASQIYQHHLLKRLRNSVTLKATRHKPPFPVERLDELDSFHKFDNAVTAPLHGFRDVGDYYARSSSKQFLSRIEIPTLLLQAIDDPFLPVDALPGAAELGPAVTLELARHGGHVGFVTGGNPLKPRYWLEERVLQHLQSCRH
jgi:predicted alpha/beta-fold hydrolase